MNLSGALSGLSATYGGYQQGEADTLALNKERSAALSKVALGNALTLLGGAGQSPMPGVGQPGTGGIIGGVQPDAAAGGSQPTPQQPQFSMPNFSGNTGNMPIPRPMGPPGLGLAPPPGFINPLRVNGQPQNLTGGIIPPGGTGQNPGGTVYGPNGPIAPPGAAVAGGAGRALGVTPVSPGAPAGGGMPRMQQGAMTVQQLAGIIQKANPGIKPDVLLGAVQQAQQLLLPEERLQFQGQMLQLREEQLNQRERDFMIAQGVKQSEGAANRGSRESIAAGNRESREDIAADTLTTRREEGAANRGSREGIAGANRESRERLAAASAEQKAALAKLSANTRKEIEASREEAGLGRIELTTRAKAELQRQSAAERRSLQEYLEAGREARSVRGEEGRNIRAQEGIESRERIAEGAEAGREMRNVRSIGERQREYDQTFQQREDQFKQKLQAANQKMLGGQASSEDIHEIANAVAHYRQAPPQSRSQNAIKIMAEVDRIAKSEGTTYDQTNWRARNDAVTRFASGKQGDTIRSLNVADNHLQTLSELAKSLQNGDAKAYNALKNFAWSQLGYPEPASFDAARQIVAAEVIKAVSAAGGGVTERLKAEAHIDRNASFQSIAGAINAYRKLLAGQIGGLRGEYETATGNKDFDEKFGFGRSFNDRFDPQKNKTSTGVEWHIEGSPRSEADRPFVLSDASPYPVRAGQRYAMVDEPPPPPGESNSLKPQADKIRPQPLRATAPKSSYRPQQGAPSIRENPELHEQMMRLLSKGGKTQAQMAEELGVSERTVRRFMTDELNVRASRGTDWNDPARIKQYKRMVDRGFSQRQMAETLEINVGTVSRQLQRMRENGYIKDYVPMGGTRAPGMPKIKFMDKPEGEYPFNESRRRKKKDNAYA